MHTVISKHILLPHSKHLFELPHIPHAMRPFITILGVQLHVAKLKDHREFLAFFGNVPIRLVLVHAAGHLTHCTVGVFVQNILIYLVHILVDTRATGHQHSKRSVQTSSQMLKLTHW